MKLPVIFVHGIGGSDVNWAASAIAKLEKKVLVELKRILGNSAPTDVASVVTVKSVYWKTALQEPQNDLQGMLAKYFGNVVVALNPFDALFRNVLKKFQKVQSTVVPMFIGDIIGYLAKEGKLGVEERFGAALDTLLVEAPGEDVPLTFVLHSLGTVITSNYIFDRMDSHREKGINRMDPRFVFLNLFTAGSPLALFSMKFGGPEHFNLPVQVEDARGRWINVIDKDDPVAMPLRLLNASYEKAVAADYPVDSGFWNWGQAHMEYFDKTDTLDVVARKLAVDWASFNKALSEADLARLYAEYDKSVSLAL
jgi:hypothetical protein